jgi:predicted ArsR family transcriptional regulator
MTEDFPDDVRQFLAEHISSVAQLEVLLLLRGDRQRQWTAEEVGKALYTTPEMVTGQLEELRARGLVTTSGGSEVRYVYRPASADLEARADRLEQTYRERRVAVITAIYSQPLDKVRTFADAFRLRKDK